MRGDSRRDLYAKTLALFGLGVLAGAGAVVDYWPVGVRFPHIASAFSAPSPLPRPLRVPESVPDSTLVSESAFAQRDTPQALTGTRVMERVSYASLPSTGMALPMGESLGLAPLPAPALVLASTDLSSVNAHPIQLAAPATSRASDVAAFGSPATEQDGSGFFVGAFRKTGSSIVRTGAKTGTSLVGAVRVVGSVVRRALPD